MRASGVLTIVAVVAAMWPAALAQNYAVSTVAGTGDSGMAGDGGPAAAAQFLLPGAAAVDGSGNVFVVDMESHRVRRIAADGTMLTVAGTGAAGFSGDGGSAVNAQLAFPYAVAVDRANGLLIADTFNHRIRRVGSDGTIATVAGTGTAGIAGDGSLAVAAQVSLPGALATDTSGAFFLTGLSDSRVRKVDPGGTITTIAGSSVPGYGGDGNTGRTALLSFPRGLVANSAGELYIADTYNNAIRKVAADAGSGTVNYSVAPNTGALRIGTIDIAGRVFTITQAASGAVPPVFSAAGVVNAASGIGAGVAPGEYVSIFGTGLGPSPGVLSASMETGLGGTSVFFNGIEAFVTYTSASQVNALVPYGISGSQTVVVEIEYAAMRSQSVALPAVDSIPGIFTRDSSGSGAAVAVNQDASLNTPDTPALRGEVVSFWATGQGQTVPPGIDGKQPVAPLFPAPSLPTKVSVGGVPVPSSDILFVGMVYAGVMQVNVRIPDGVAAGPEPIVLQVGDASSRPDVTISVADPGQGGPTK